MDRDFKKGVYARQVTFGYHGKKLINSLDLDLQCGDFTVLLGANGSGKSTILRLMSGYLRSGSGEVLLSGRALRSYPASVRARRIAMMSQNAPPALDFTVFEMALQGGMCSMRHRFAGPDAVLRERVAAICSQLGLEELLERPCNRLSGGEFQRVMLASVLAQGAEYLFLDEVTSALDPAHCLRVLELLSGLAGSGKYGVMLSTHDVYQVLPFAGRVILLKKGRIVADGRPEDVVSGESLADIYECSGIAKIDFSRFMRRMN